MSLKLVLKYLFHLSPLLLVTGTIIGIVYYKRLSKFHRALWLYLLVGAMTDLIGRFFGVFFDYNLVIIPLFGLLELGLFSWIYYHFFLKPFPGWLKYWLLTMMGLIVVDIILVFRLPAEDFQSYGRVVDGLNVLLLSLLFIGQSLISGSKVDRVKSLVNSCVLFYILTALLVFLPVNFLINTSSTSDIRFVFWLLHFTVTITFYLILIYLIWKNGRTHKPSLSGSVLS